MKASSGSGTIVRCLEAFKGPNFYTSGGTTFSSEILAQIERALVVGPTTLGFTAQVVSCSISGNNFKIQFFVQGLAKDGGHGEVANATDLSSHAFYLLEEGLQFLTHSQRHDKKETRKSSQVSHK